MTPLVQPARRTQQLGLPRVLANMRRVLILFALAVPTQARAGGALTAHGEGEALEASYQLDIEVHGLFATVESRQRLLAATPGPVEAVYEFQLPADAAVTGFTITMPGAKPQPGVIATAEGAVGPASGTIGDDRGTLIQVDRGRAPTPDDPGAVATYRYTAFPLWKDGMVVTMRWIMPVQLDQGRVVLALPARPGTDLADAEGTIRFAPVAGLTAPHALRVGGTVIAKTPGPKPTRWKLPAGGPIVIEADVATRGDRPVLIADTVALGKDRGAIAAAVVAPEASATGRAAERVVFVVDASRSMRRVDRGAVVSAIQAMAAAAPATAKLQAIGFDHDAHQLLDRWRDNDPAGRTALGDAVAALGDANGTDPAAALAAAAAATDPGHPTQIVVITDGGIDPTIDTESLVAALGDRLTDVDVSSLVVVPAGRRAPGRAVGLFEELARRVGGRVRIIHADALADSAPRLSLQLADDVGWSAPVVAGTTLVFPALIAPGDGATAIGWYRGKPGRLALAIQHGDRAATTAAVKAGIEAAPLGLGRDGAALALAGETGEDASAKASAAWDAAVRAHPVVTATSLALVVDTSTSLGRDRRALIARGAPYALLPPPPERENPLDGWDQPEVHLDGAFDPSAGTIEPDAIKNLLTIELLGRLRGCYQQALPHDPTLHGRVTLDLLMGDGELISAAALGAQDPTFRTCLVTASHAIQVPVAGDPSMIRVRYPVDFTVAADKKTFVVLGDADSAEPIDPSLLPTASTDVDDPLGGIHR